jgi:hypothetical protein
VTLTFLERVVLKEEGDLQLGNTRINDSIARELFRAQGQDQLSHILRKRASHDLNILLYVKLFTITINKNQDPSFSISITAKIKS